MGSLDNACFPLFFGRYSYSSSERKGFIQKIWIKHAFSKTDYCHDEYSSSNVEYKYEVIFLIFCKSIRIKRRLEKTWHLRIITKSFFYLSDKLYKIDVKAKAGEKKKIADFADLYQHRK